MAVDVDAVAVATEACPGVAGLSSGRFAEVATYLPGRRVVGVRATEDELEVHVVAQWEVALPFVAAEVRSVVVPLSGGLPVAVFIDDIDIPPSLFGVEEGPPELPGEVVEPGDPIEEVTLLPGQTGVEELTVVEPGPLGAPLEEEPKGRRPPASDEDLPGDLR